MALFVTIVATILVALHFRQIMTAVGAIVVIGVVLILLAH
jgi:hypothetical protein